MPRQYTPCPNCGNPKRAEAAVCRSCWLRAQDDRIRDIDPNPSGLCECGCGQRTNIAKVSSPRTGIARGKHYRYINGHAPRSSPLAYVVNDAGCWVWQRGTTPEGYGKVSAEGRTTFAHIVEYTKKHGPVPPGKVLDHTCRNRRCCNPDHLEPVTHVENCRRGAGTKLSANDVAEIRALAGTMFQREIADRFGISQSHVHRIIYRREWRDDQSE